MLNGKILIRPALSQSCSDNIFRILDQGGSRVEIVLSVEIKIDPVVTQRLHVGPAARCFCTIGVRRAHVCRPHSDDVIERHLVFNHLSDSKLA